MLTIGLLTLIATSVIGLVASQIMERVVDRCDPYRFASRSVDEDSDIID